MVKLNYFIFGYRTVSIEKDRCAALISLFLRRGVSSAAVGDGAYVISRRDFSRIRRELEAIGARSSSVCGLPTLIYTARARFPVLLALGMAVILNLYLSELVWDVRISGNTSVPDYVIRSALDDAGLSVGSAWSSLDRSMIETEASLALDEIGWLNINRRGTVAYVEVVERAYVPKEEPVPDTPCNIVAEVDCIIEDIQVVRGTPCVLPGDVVRRGDVLISGVVEGEGSVSFVRAEGHIRGLVSGSITASAEKEEWAKELEGHSLVELRVNIFGFSINIFKNYGNSDETCDIIEKNESFVVRDAYRLPFGFTRRYAALYTDVMYEYTDSELLSLALSRHNAALAHRLADGELVKISTTGEYTDNGYRVSSSIVYSEDVGEVRELGVDK